MTRRFLAATVALLLAALGLSGCGGPAGSATSATCQAVSYKGSNVTLRCNVGVGLANPTCSANAFDGATLDARCTFPASSTPTPPATSPTPTPTPTGPPSSTSYVQPGTVGYRGTLTALTVYQPGGAAPAGCTWQAYGLRCDSSTLTLDHAWVKGGIYFTGSGNVTVTQSIIQGGSGSEWYAFYDAAPSSSARLTFTDSTLGWLAGHTYPSGYDVAPIWTRSGESMDVERSDLSGMPQGLDPGGNSIIRNNWIHGLAQNSTDSSKPTHLDGLFSQGGSNITISGNYIDAPLRNPSDITAAVFFQSIPCQPMTGITVSGNYLHGGSFTLYNQCAQGLKVTGNTFAGGTYGDATQYANGVASIAAWSGNVHADGSSVAQP